MPERDILQAANEVYADGFTKGHLPMPPARRLAIVTCMDARLDPARFLGLEEGDAHVIRNAGGIVTEDAIRSLVISHWLLGTEEVAVIGHTDCGMVTFTNDDLRAKLRAEAGADASHVDFRPFADLDESVRDSLRAIRESPLLPDSLELSGWIYDVKSGRIREVAGVRAAA
jgi:carbonic anhydrase